MNNIVGINFEGGKIITSILRKYGGTCTGYANCQIAMDAPFHGRVADESVRGKGRSESQFTDYREGELKENLRMIFEYIHINYHHRVIIQIARGRSGQPMFDEVIKPILEMVGIHKYKTVYGYRSTDYFNENTTEKFVFVNIGMFAVLSGIEQVYVGEVCNPTTTYSIESYDKQKGFTIADEVNTFDDSKNILNKVPDIKKITLFSIADDMKFISPDEYSSEHIQDLVVRANKSDQIGGYGKMVPHDPFEYKYMKYKFKYMNSKG